MNVRGGEESGLKLPHEDVLIRVRDLEKHFPIYEGILRRKVAEVRAVDGISFDIPKGQTFGLVGESGSGKTTVGRSMLRIIEPTGGTVEFDGKDLLSLGKADLRAMRRRMQIVFQDPTSSLNPRRRVRDIVAKPLQIHGIGTKEERIHRVEELLDTVGLSTEYLYKYPGSLSGGQKQRVGLARALALHPDFLILDEPTSSLDVSVQARVISLLEDIQEEFDLTYMFITHNLSLIRNIADWVGVMYLGRLVEVGPIESVFHSPQHPYTRGLLSAVSTITDEDERIKPPEMELKGEIPDPRERPTGCGFRTRCPKEFEDCSAREPPMYDVGDRHQARCFLHDADLAPDGPSWEG